LSGFSESSKLISSQESAVSDENKSKEKGSDDSFELCFSYRERRWKAKKGSEGRIYKKSKFFWTGEVEVWDYPACRISLVRASDEKLKIVVRRKKLECSAFLKRQVEIRRMIGFDLEKIYRPWEDKYIARENEGHRKVIEGPLNRWVFQFNDNCWVWEWAKEGKSIEDSDVYRFYKDICEEISNPSKKSDNIFKAKDVADIDPEAEEGAIPKNIVPVIYQPAVDCMKNFVRIVHCTPCKTGDGYCEVEVSILFNNEQLRQHSFFNNIYEVLRYYLYGRTLDVETFRIRFKKDIEGHKLIFHGIYSGKHDLEYDSIHGDSVIPAPEHDVKYYFIQQEHPVVFINTSNHSMAEFDANHSIWKWEYIPWLDNAPVELGHKNRNHIEAEVEEEITKEIESKPFLSQYILKIAQKYRKVKQLSI